MGTPGPSPETTLEAALEVFERQDEPCTPLTATEVAEELDCTRRTAHRKLEELSENGELHSKKTGARSRIWWRSLSDQSADGPPPEGQSRDEPSTDTAGTGTATSVALDEEGQPVLEQFGAFVSAVEDYAIFMLDPDGVVVSWNEGARRIKGYEEGEIVGEHFTVFYEDADVEQGVPAHILKTAREEGRVEHEGWRVRADGSRFWANVTVTAVRDDEGSLMGFTKVTRDLTERRNYERALEEERNLLNRIIDTTPVGIMVRDADGDVTRANSGVTDILGITAEEVANHSVPDLPFFDEEGEPMSAEEHPYSVALATGEPVPDQVCQIERPDGERRWLSMNAIPLTNDEGEVERVVTTGDDITELKERERQLRRERNQTDELLKTAPVSIAVQDADGETVLANRRAQEVLGLSEREIVERSDGMDDFVVSDADETALAPHERPTARVLETGEPVFDEEIAIERPDGERIWFSINAAPVTGPDGDVDRVITTGKEITELKKRTDELETELSEILGRVSDAFYALDEEWRFTHVNDQAETTLQRFADELLGKSFWEAFPEAAEGEVGERYRQAMDTQEPVTFEGLYEPLDGWFEIAAYPSETGLSVYFRDVTERKERERRLEEYRRWNQTLVDNVPSGAVALVDETLRYVTFGGTVEGDVDLERDELEGEPVDEVLPGGFADVVVPGYEAALDGKPAEFEETVGDSVYQFHFVPVRDDSGDVFAAAGMSQDVTERKEREQYLRKAKLQLEAATEAGAVGTWEWHIPEDRFVTGPSLARTFGIDPDAATDGIPLDRLMSSIYEDDRDMVEREIEEAVASCGEYEAEYRVWNADGELQWVVARGHVECDDDGAPLKFPGVLIDITERKERERELAESEQRYRTLIEHFPNGAVALVDGDLNYRTVGGTPLDVAGATAEELEGMPAEKVLPPDLADEIVPRYEDALDGEISSFELDLGDRAFQFQIVPVRDDSGDVFAAMGMSQEITERKRHERELERFRTIVETVNDGVYTVDEEGRFTMVNEAYAGMTGYSREELVGSHVSLVIDDDVAASARELEGELLAGGTETSKIEAELVTADGGTITAEATFAMLPDEEGGAERVGVVRDISERKAYERALEESERRYRTVVEHFPNGLVGLFDEDLRYTAAGGELIDQVGIDLDEAIGSTIHERFPEDLLAEVEPYFRGALEGEQFTFEAEYHDRHLQAHTLPIRNGDGEIFAGMLMVQDVTDRVEREREIEEQRERYRRLVDVAPVAIVTYDAGGEIQFANAATAELVGVDDPESLVGTPAIEYIHPDERAESAGRIRTMLEDRESVPPTERRIVTDDGEIKHVLIASIPITHGGEPAAQTVLVDVTERKEHERELEARAAQQDVVAELGQRALENPSLDDLFDEAVEALADTLDNDYAKVLELQDDDELLLRSGVGWHEGLVGDATVGTESDSQAGYTLESTAPVVVDDLETESRFDGPPLLTEHDVSAGISTIIGPPGDPWGVLGTHDTDRTWFTAQDVSFVQSVANILMTAIERTRYEQELNETVARLRESNERLEQFAYIASHDLQEPLRMISNYLQLLEGRYSDELDEDARDFIDFAVDGAERMKEMINDLLAYSRVETEAEPMEPVDSEAAVSNALDDLRLRIEENDAEIVVGDLPTVVADGNQLEQVFQNLVSNALKYRGEDPPRVEIDAERGDGEWLFRVSDNGIGIDPAHVDRIFEVFKRLHTTEEYPGTGIGLALCEKIVDRHGGRIWVESEEGEGSTFWFTVPFGGQDED